VENPSFHVPRRGEVRAPPSVDKEVVSMAARRKGRGPHVAHSILFEKKTGLCIYESRKEAYFAQREGEEEADFPEDST